MDNARRRFVKTAVATAAAAGLQACGGGGGEAAPPPPAAGPTTPATDWPVDYQVPANARYWYVAPTGSNTQPGTQAQPFATIQHAASVVQPGDVVEIASGRYTEAVLVQRGGVAGRYVTFRAATPGGVQLVGPEGSYSAFKLEGVGWVRVEGLDVTAAAGHGIEAEGSHHIQVVNNTCHDCGGSGISLEAGDYYWVDGNTAFGNCATNTFQTSGISLYQARAFDASPGFHILITRNVCFANLESRTGLAETSEGNGIILDDFHNSQNSPGGVAAGPYAHASLVENNLAFGNGGGGIVVFETSHAVVRHNTVAHNLRDPLNPGTWRGELACSNGRSNAWYNNISVCSTQLNRHANALLEMVTEGFNNTGNLWAGNLAFDSAAPQRDALLVAGTGNLASSATLLANNRFRADPRFLAGPDATTVAGFGLQSDSPALHAALPAQAAQVDLLGRVRGNPADLGALESTG
jgi:parallel beta-helix repeat protein